MVLSYLDTTPYNELSLKCAVPSPLTSSVTMLTDEMILPPITTISGLKGVSVLTLFNLSIKDTFVSSYNFKFSCIKIWICCIRCSSGLLF